MKRNFQSLPNIEYSQSNSTARTRVARGVRRGGFTLIELLVVIAIAAILSAFLLSGFLSFGASNKRTSCQVNLQQIYGALKMYATDNDGAYPYYNASPATNGGTNSISTPEDTHFGLWALYTNDRVTNSSGSLDFPSNRVADADNSTPTELANNPLRPVGIYLRNSGNLHCPADLENAELYNDTRTAFNPNYLSYQVIDDSKDVFPASTVSVATYQSQRVTASGTANWKRQLMFWDGTNRVFDQRAASNTVITWCKWHRTGLGGHNSDPILFADGSVRSKILMIDPATSPLPLSEQTGQPIPGWQRTNE